MTPHLTHLQVLIRELARHGQTTYRDLVARYERRGYTRMGFVQAAMQAERKGAAVRPYALGGAIVAGACPTCGRYLHRAPRTALAQPAGAPTDGGREEAPGNEPAI